MSGHEARDIKIAHIGGESRARAKSLMFDLALGAAIFLAATPAHARFQFLIPDRDVVTETNEPEVRFDIRFASPMDPAQMTDMAKPAAFGVMKGEDKTDLLDALRERKIGDTTAYEASYRFKEPGDYIFYLEPAPVWVPARDKMVIHYTKAVVGVRDVGYGWDAPVDFPAEIRPLTRPYGLWAGSVFQGVAIKNGMAMPNAAVEMSYFNEARRADIPSPLYAVQVVKTDPNGVFTVALPRAGWWVFAFVTDGDDSMTNPSGRQVAVEIAGVLWVHAVDMK